MGLPRAAHDPRVLAAMLFVLTLAAYAPTLGYGFVWDDQNVIVDSEKLAGWSGLVGSFANPAGWSTRVEGISMSTYRPLALASFVVDRALWGLAPAGYHFTSALLHALAQVMVFWFVLRWTRSAGVAFGVAVLCALHPAAAEAAAWVNGRSELFALLFGAAALVAARGGRPVVTAVLLLFALLGKESAAVFLVIAPLVAGTDEARARVSVRWPFLAASVAAAAAYATMRALALDGGAPPGGGLGQVVVAAAPLLGKATQAALIPVDHAPLTLQRWIAALGAVEVAVAWSGLVAAAALLLWCMRRGKASIWVPALWWLGGLAPAAFVVTTPWPGLNRWLYLALPGLLLAIHAALATRLPARALAWIGLAAALAFGLLTTRALPVWRSNTTLYSAMIEEAPDDPFGYVSLGIEKASVGNYPVSVYLLEAAVKLGDVPTLTWEYLVMGWARTGQCDRARALRARLPQPVLAADLSAALAACVPQRQ